MTKPLELLPIRRRNFAILTYDGEAIDKLGPGNTQILGLLIKHFGQWVSHARIASATTISRYSIASQVYVIRTILREEDIPYVIRSSTGPASMGYMLDKQ